MMPTDLSGGVNGSPPWSKHEVAETAHWIWNAETVRARPGV